MLDCKTIHSPNDNRGKTDDEGFVVYIELTSIKRFTLMGWGKEDQTWTLCNKVINIVRKLRKYERWAGVSDARNFMQAFFMDWPLDLIVSWLSLMNKKWRLNEMKSEKADPQTNPKISLLKRFSLE